MEVSPKFMVPWVIWKAAPVSNTDLKGLIFPSPLPVGLFRQDQNYANSLLFLLMLSSKAKKGTQKLLPVFTDALFSL